ncbi:hypothetical protein [Nonomuraea candida]|uniref:hypothetical protein n=1 Tax=Nonomuraea candida TaxID=359159 RepID=UPI0005B94F14|nr:hypothetical protein [Nonomuraea candida]
MRRFSVGLAAAALATIGMQTPAPARAGVVDDALGCLINIPILSPNSAETCLVDANANLNV